MDRQLVCEKDKRGSSTFLDLPLELLAYIISFFTVARDKLKFRYVSTKLRSASETPSLWREFVWPYYHPGDIRCVNNALKVCGRHVELLSFPNHVIPIYLGLFEHCRNLIELSLPKAKLDPKQLGRILACMKPLERLEVEWDSDVRKLLEVVDGSKVKDLTIRIPTSHVSLSEVTSLTGSWVLYWMTQKFIPRNLNIITSLLHVYVVAIWKSWQTLNSKSPADHTGHVNIYYDLKSPLNLYAILPDFQVDFGQSVCLPFVKPSRSFGLMGLKGDLFLITNCVHGSKVEYNSCVMVNLPECLLLPNIDNLKFVTDFDCFNGKLTSEHLEQLSVGCCNLQRLSLKFNEFCLRRLKGLRAIANSCHKLQGLNLSWISVTEVENQIQLWKILSSMKLTHLVVDLCVLLKDRHRMAFTFQKCTNLQAIESPCGYRCNQCTSNHDKLSMLSNFPSLIYYKYYARDDHDYAKCLDDILNGCKKLRCLGLNNLKSASLSSVNISNLQQLWVECATKVPDNFMTAISAHGGLVHVVLSVRSVTSEGVAALVRNSPNLLTFHAIVYIEICGTDGTEVLPEELESSLKQEFSHTQLFTMGSYFIHSHCGRSYKLYQYNYTDISFLWHGESVVPLIEGSC